MDTETLSQLLQDRAEKRAVVLATNLKSNQQKLIYPFDSKNNSSILDDLREAAIEAALADRGRTIETPDGDLFLNVFNPPLRMIIVGAVHISQPLSVMAQEAGYQVTVVDPRRAFATPERFPGMDLRVEWPDEALKTLDLDRRTAVVSLTHDPKLDDPALVIALASRNGSHDCRKARCRTTRSRKFTAPSGSISAPNHRQRSRFRSWPRSPKTCANRLIQLGPHDFQSSTVGRSRRCHPGSQHAPGRNRL